MSRLEVEYDYNTDSEQATQSKQFLEQDLFLAVEFFVKENPLKLVDNIDIPWSKNCYEIILQMSLT